MVLGMSVYPPIHYSQDISKIKFDGDIPKYVEDLSRMVFSSISSTCEDFQESFKEPTVNAGTLRSHSLVVR